MQSARGSYKEHVLSFADPQSVTINAVPISLPRVSSGVSFGAFRAADTLTDLSVATSYGKRTRATVRLSSNKLVPDPLVTGRSERVNMTAYLVVDTPRTGFTVAEAKQVVDGLVAYLTATTGARITQLLGGEN